MSLDILFTFVLQYLHTRPHLAAQIRERTPVSYKLSLSLMAGWLESCMLLFILISSCPTWSTIYSMCCNPLLVSAAMLGWSHRSAYSIFECKCMPWLLAWYLYRRNKWHPIFRRCIHVQAISIQASPLHSCSHIGYLSVYNIMINICIHIYFCC